MVWGMIHLVGGTPFSYKGGWLDKDTMPSGSMLLSPITLDGTICGMIWGTSICMFSFLDPFSKLIFSLLEGLKLSFVGLL